jgi:hypothetical protein
MRADKDIIAEMEKLFEEYNIEVEAKRKAGVLKDKTAKTYLLHPKNFIRWCKEDFVPGGRNLIWKKRE